MPETRTQGNWEKLARYDFADKFDAPGKNLAQGLTRLNKVVAIRRRCGRKKEAEKQLASRFCREWEQEVRVQIQQMISSFFHLFSNAMPSLRLTGPVAEKNPSEFKLANAPSTFLAATTSSRPLFAKIMGYVVPEIIEARSYQGNPVFSGTSLAALEHVIDTSEGFDPRQTFVSDNIGLSYGYARTRAWRDQAPRLMLAFPAERIWERLKMGDYQPTVTDPRTGYTVQLGNYYQATAPIAPSEISDETKESVLAWLEKQRAEQPQLRQYWDGKIQKFTAAFYPHQ